MEMRWAQYSILISLYLAIILLAIGSSGASSKLMDAPDRLSICNSSDNCPASTSAIINGDVNGTADVLIQGWRGLAIKADESLPFRLNVETIRTIPPAEARRLLASNMSVEEVRSLARSGDRSTVLRGHIRLNNDFYPLTDITLTSSGNGSALKASVARSGSGDVAYAVGHAVVTISATDDLGVAKGYVVIDDSKYSGNYSLALNECPGPGPRAGMPRGGQKGFGRRG
jgi:hypothetical protein